MAFHKEEQGQILLREMTDLICGLDDSGHRRFSQESVDQTFAYLLIHGIWKFGFNDLSQGAQRHVRQLLHLISTQKADTALERAVVVEEYFTQYPPDDRLFRSLLVICHAELDRRQQRAIAAINPTFSRDGHTVGGPQNQAAEETKEPSLEISPKYRAAPQLRFQLRQIQCL